FSLSSFFEELAHYENFSIVQSYFWPLGYVFIVFCLVFFAFQILKRRAIPLAILFLFTLATLFPLFLVPFFKSHVAWRMNIQYFVLILPVVFFALALMLRFIVDHLNTKIIFKNMIVITFFAASSFAYDWGPLTHLEKTYEQIEFRRAYKILNEQSTDRDLDLVFCLNTTSWCPDNFILQSFHYKKSPGGIAYGWENPVFNNYLNALKGAVVPDNIYFIYYSIWSGKQLPEPTPYRIEHLHGLDLFKVPVQKQNLAQTMIDFCKPWVDQGLAENELYVAPVEFIVASASSLGQIKLKNYYLQLYKDFKGPKANSVYLNKLLQEP
ncbi:MAG: hypothetical protein K2P92_07895, partial [Bdellovibrionaceae bacterium]|nr:hypothetical protein [Pseudobdellovibrionaceae bacterium]